MGHSKDDVVATGLRILDEYGLPGLSMRRLATTLGVQQSALYWHFESKQVLLAAMAEEILRRGAGRGPADAAASPFDAEAAVVERAVALRRALLSYRDGAELVSTVFAFGLGADAPQRDLVEALSQAGVAPADASAAATVILHFVFGYTFSEQQHRQASSVGAVGLRPRAGAAAGAGGTDHDPFLAGLALVLDGVRARRAAGAD